MQEPTTAEEVKAADDPSPKRKRRRRKPMRPGLRFVAKGAFYTHLWLGVLVTVVLVAISVTGILLNHKSTLGYQPGPENPTPAALEASLPIAELAERARATHPDGPDVPIDRMDVRPDKGLIKVRFEDRVTTEITLALDDGRVLETGRRGDVFLEKLHSGEIFGDGWILLSDAAAVGLLLLVVSGVWLWLFPRWRQ